jgi:hypothetical protein
MITDDQEEKSKEAWAAAVLGTASIQQPERKFCLDQLE